MNRKTRLFLLIGGSVLATGIGVGLVASYMGLSAVALRGTDLPAELKYVPADAQVVAYADVEALVHSEFRRTFLENRKASPQRPSAAGELESIAGIDPERDLRTVVIFIAALPPQGGHRQTGLLARGRFNASHIESAMRERGAEAVEYRGTRVVQRAGERGDVGMAFLEPDLMAFGSAAAVRQSIDLLPGGQSITGNGQMMELIGRTAGGNVWAAGSVDAIARHDRLPKEMSERLPALGHFVATGQVGSGLEGTFHVEARDETAARDLRDVIQGFLALARLQSDSGTAAGALLDSIQLAGEDRTVSVTFTVSGEAVAALASDLPPRDRVW